MALLISYFLENEEYLEIVQQLLYKCIGRRLRFVFEEFYLLAKKNDRIDFKACFPQKMKYKIFDPILRYEIFRLYSVYSNTSQDKFTSSDTLTRPNFISIPNIYSLLTSTKENLCSTSIVNRDTF
jgi:hypothetical protein